MDWISARLALYAGETTPLEEIMTQPSVEKVIEPNSSPLANYDHAFQVFRNIYPSIKELK